MQDAETEAQREEISGLRVPGLNPGDLAPDGVLLLPQPESDLKAHTGNLVAPGGRTEGDSAGTVGTHPALPSCAASCARGAEDAGFHGSPHVPCCRKPC